MTFAVMVGFEVQIIGFAGEIDTLKVGTIFTLTVAQYGTDAAQTVPTVFPHN